MIALNRIALNTSSLSFTLGYKKRINQKKNQNPVKLNELFIIIKKLKLGGIEFPYFRFYDNQKTSHEIKKTLINNKLFCIIDSDKKISTSQIKQLIPIAKRLNSKIIRIKASDILCSERWKINSGWNKYLNNLVQKLKSLKKILLKNNLKIAIENHQDLDSFELKYIVEKVGKDVVGINFDIGNSLATCENPLMFAKRIAPYIINVHIKDYKLSSSRKGIVLNRCAIGKGDVDFKKTLDFIIKKCPNASYSVELGALQRREILGKEKIFWENFKYNLPQKKKYFNNLLNKTIKKKNLAKNPWENNFSSKSILNYEMKELKESVKFLKNLS